MSDDLNAEPLVILEDDAFNGLIQQLRLADDLPREACLRVATLHFASFILSHSRIRAVLKRLNSLEAAVNQMREPAAIQTGASAAAPGALADAEDTTGWKACDSCGKRIPPSNEFWWGGQVLCGSACRRDVAKREDALRRDLDVMKRELDRVQRELGRASARAVAMERERNDWQETASTNIKGQQFYHDLLTKAGNCFGVAARTSDDGSVQQDVLALKVPELVQEAVDLLRAYAPEQPRSRAQWAVLRDRVRALLPETPKGS